MLYENLVSGFMLILGAGGMVFVQSFTKETTRIMPEVAFSIMIILSVITLMNNIIHAKTAASSKPVNAAKNTDEKSAAERKRFWMLFFIKFVIILFFLSPSPASTTSSWHRLPLSLWRCSRVSTGNWPSRLLRSLPGQSTVSSSFG